MTCFQVVILNDVWWADMVEQRDRTISPCLWWCYWLSCLPSTSTVASVYVVMFARGARNVWCKQDHTNQLSPLTQWYEQKDVVLFFDENPLLLKFCCRIPACTLVQKQGKIQMANFLVDNILFFSDRELDPLPGFVIVTKLPTRTWVVCWAVFAPGSSFFTFGSLARREGWRAKWSFHRYRHFVYIGLIPAHPSSPKLPFRLISILFHLIY